MGTVCSESGQMVCGKEEVINRWKEYFESLLKGDTSVVQAVKRVEHSKVVHNNEEISLEEVYASIRELYNTLVLPHLQYCSTVWLPCSQALSLRLERVQNYSMRVILNQPPRTPSAFLRKQLNRTTLAQRRQNHMLSQVHRFLIGRAPSI